MLRRHFSARASNVYSEIPWLAFSLASHFGFINFSFFYAAAAAAVLAGKFATILC